MKKITLFFCLQLTATVLSAQNSEALTGAWQRENQGNRQTLVFVDGFWSFTEFNEETREFAGTMGGSFKVSGGELTEHIEFNSFGDDMDYQPLDGKLEVNANEIKIGSSGWTRIDDGTPGDLAGAWLITGRKRDGEITTRTPGARKTMKILSGTRFQWIAFNTETMEFRGTGGGSYTTVNGKYTENIEFFSRDASRVGASLEFEYELLDGAWHHSGKSSQGDSMYEVWELRSKLNL